MENKENYHWHCQLLSRLLIFTQQRTRRYTMVIHLISYLSGSGRYKYALLYMGKTIFEIADKMFEFRIVGSNDTVKHPKDEAETKRRRKEDESTQEKINETATKILDVHPMSLEFDIECPNEIKITMTIQYLTELKVTTAKWMVHGDSKARKSVLFCADSLMSDLFENDSGDKCPNKVGSLKIEHLKYVPFFHLLNTYTIFRLNFNSNAKSTGKPYLFIQELSGSDQQIEGVAVTEHLRKIVKAIRQRVADRCALDSIIRDLESKKTEGLEVATDVKICSFKNCEDEAFIASIPTSLRDQISGGTSSDRFSFKLEATNGDNKK